MIDCNRPLASPQSIAEHSAGILVPGNQGLRPAERRARVEALFEPYHAAIDRLLDSRTRRPSLLLAIHSFTPRLQGRTRPWPVGISPGRDRRFGQRLARALAQQTDRVVGEDQPYAIEAGIDHTLPTHGDARGLANAMVEIRQDGICSPAEADAWARHLARAWLAIAAEFAGSAEQA